MFNTIKCIFSSTSQAKNNLKSPPVKDHWLDRAIQVYNFHCNQLKDEKNWTIKKTADALNRSIGSVSQDILLANWSKTHDKQLRRFGSMKDALKFVHKNQHEHRIREIES